MIKGMEGVEDEMGWMGIEGDIMVSLLAARMGVICTVMRSEEWTV